MKKTRKAATSKDDRPVLLDNPLDILKKISGEADEAIPVAAQTLKEVRYVPTIFTSFNRAVVVGGAPVRATWLVHGPPAGGKTAFSAGILRSFQEQGHVAALLDAEHAADKAWLKSMGLDLDRLLFCQPDSFENAIETMDKWIGNFSQLKKSGQLSADACFAIAVDTIHKAAPKKELKLALERDKEVNKGWGRYRANLISQWIDRMTPVVGKNDVALILLAHEHEKESDDNQWGWGDDYRVKGGQALVFESMVRVRVRASKLWADKGGKKYVVGKAHHFLVEKNKVGYPLERGTFFTSNGKGLAPIGFDLAKEIFTEAVQREVIHSSGSWYSFGEARAQGEEKMVQLIRDDLELYQTIYSELTHG